MSLNNGFEILAAKQDAPRADLKKAQGLPDLSNPAVDDFLSEKYRFLTDPDPLYRNMASVYATMAGILSAQELYNMGYQYYDPRLQASFPEMFKAASNEAASKVSHYYTQDAKYVEVGVSLPELNFTLYHPVDPKSSDQVENTQDGLRIIRAYFPKFQLPKNWKVDQDKEKNVNVRQPILESVADPAIYSLEQLTRIKPTYTPNGFGERGDDQYPQLSQDYEPYAQYVWLKMELEPVDVRSQAPEKVLDPNAKGGSLVGSDYGVHYNITCTGILRFPLEYALWATQTTTQADYVPLDFWSLISRRNQYYNIPSKGRRGDGHRPPARVAEIATAFHSYERWFNVEKKRKAVSKVNEDDLTILANGAVIWVPPTNRIGIYRQLVKGAWNPQRQEITPPGDIKNLANQSVFADWHTDKLVYTDDSGAVQVTDLVGAKPLDDITIYRKLSSVVNPEKALRLAQIISSAMIEFGFEAKLDPVEVVTAHIKQGSKWIDLANDKGLNPLLRDTHRYFEKIDIPFREKMSFARYLCVVLTKYADSFAELKAIYEKSLAADLVPDPQKVTKAFNLPGLSVLYPHQARVNQMLEAGLPTAIIDVAPGSDYILQALMDITRLLGEVKVERPLVVAQTERVSEWVRSGYHYGAGKLNIFPITREVWQRWTENVGLTQEQISKIIKSQPHNTIFITDDELIEQNVQQGQYADRVFSYWPMAKYLADVGFDYVFCNGVYHSDAAKIVASTAKYLRLGGEASNLNVASHLCSQMSFINAAAVKDEKESIYESVSLKKSVAPYVSRIRVTRDEWFALLPQVKENFYPISLTPNQQKAYEKNERRILSNIRADEDLTRMIESADPSMQHDVEFGLRDHFRKVEAHLNCPRSTPGDGFDTHDLISTKVACVNKIIELHLNGGEQSINGTKTIEKMDPMDGKIIIVTHDVHVSGHVFKHMTHYNNAIHYIGGDNKGLASFRSNDRIKVMVTDDQSLRTIFDVPMVTRIIRLQSPWTSGEQREALSQILRPSGDSSYARDLVVYDWLVFTDTVEVAKSARRMLKVIDLTKIEYSDFATYASTAKNTFGTAKLEPFSFDLIKKFRNFADLEATLAAFKSCKQWLDNAADGYRAKLKDWVTKMGTKDVPNLIAASMRPVDNRYEIPNTPTTQSYYPWLTDIAPLDLTQLNLIALSSTPDKDIEEGMLVVTEFGPGTVARFRKDTDFVRVQVPGFASGSFVLKRNVVYRPTNQEQATDLRDRLQRAGDRGLPYLKLAGAVSTDKQLPASAPANIKTPGEVEKSNSVDAPEHTMGKPWRVDMHAALFNMQLALYVEGNGNFNNRLINRGWMPIGKVIGCQVKSHQALSRLLLLLKRFFIVPVPYQAEMEKFRDVIARKDNDFEKIGVRDIEPLRDFFRGPHRPAISRLEVHPFLSMVNDQVFVFFNASFQPGAERLFSAPKLMNVSTFKDYGEMLVKFFTDYDAAKKELESLEGLNVVIENQSDLQKSLTAVT